MAVFRPLLGELRGSIAGLTWQRGPHGATVHKRQHQVNRNAARQQLARVNLANLGNLWRGLSDADRDRWRLYSDWLVAGGELRSPGGWTAFCWFNARNQRWFGGTSLTPPVRRRSPTAPRWLTATVLAGGLQVRVTYSPSPIAATRRPIIWTGRPGTLRPPQNWAHRRWTNIGSVSQTSPWTTTLSWIPVIGQEVLVWVAVLDQGTMLHSPPYPLRATRTS